MRLLRPLSLIATPVLALTWIACSSSSGGNGGTTSGDDGGSSSGNSGSGGGSGTGSSNSSSGGSGGGNACTGTLLLPGTGTNGPTAPTAGTPSPVKLPPPSVGATGEAAAGDLDGDHHDDVVAIDATGVSAYLSKAGGTFSAPVHTDVAGTHPALHLVVGDFNNDHKADAVVWDGQNTTPLIGHGDGTFTAGTPVGYPYGSFSPPGTPPRPVAVDFDKDGSLDLVVAICNQGKCPMLILRGKGDGTFPTQNIWKANIVPSPPWNPNYEPAPRGLITGDFDRDGHLDIAFAQDGTTQGATSSMVVTYGDGTGAFTPAAIPAGVNGAPEDIGAGDFNGDGALDVAVGEVFSNNGSAYAINVSLGPVSMLTSGSKVRSAGAGSRLAVADLNGDGSPDLASIDAQSVDIAISRGDGTFGAYMRYWCDVAGDGAWIDLGDFNGDGKPDVLVSGTRGLEVLIDSGCMGSGINGVSTGTGSSSGGSSGSSSGSSSSSSGGGPSCNIGTPFQPPGGAMCPSNNQCSAPPYSCVTPIAVQQGLKCCCDAAGTMCIGCQQTETCGGAYNSQPVSCCN